MAGRLRGWLALTGRERLQFLALVCALAIVHAALAALGYVRTRRALEQLSQCTLRHDPTPEDLTRARRLAELAAVAGRHGLVKATCLRQSLVVYAWLRRRKLEPALHLGVRKTNELVDAHAWVELARMSLEPGPVEHASLTARGPASGPA